MKKIVSTSAFFLFAVMFFTSCVKDDNSASDTSIASDNYTAQKESDDIVDAVDAAALDIGALRLDEMLSTLLPECAHIEFDTTSALHFLQINFDTLGNGCLCSDWDNKYRKGSIRAEWSGRYRQKGTVITVQTINYYVNKNKFDFFKTVTNNGKNSSGHTSFTVKVTTGKITFNDGTSMTWTSDRTREWMEGEGSLTPLDDVYQITGSASGMSRNGDDYTLTITNPLEVSLGCRWIQKGTIVIMPEGKSSRTLDFGTGGCDQNATVEIDGNVYNINL